MTENLPRPTSFVRRLLRSKVQRAVDVVVPRALERSEPEHVDEDALAAFEDLVAFKRRFGFLWSRADRMRLLFYKNDHGLSDGQVRRLYVTRTLVPAVQGLRIQATRWEAAVGWIHIAILVVFFGPLLILGLLAHQFQLSSMQWIGLGLVTTSIIAIGWAYYAFYVAPWRLHVRIKEEQAACLDVRDD